jgi:hypothetical protein
VTSRRARAGWLAGASATVAGCATSLDLARVRTLGPGEQRVSGGLDIVGISPRLLPEQPINVPWLLPQAGWRAGIGARTDAGFHVSAFGLPTVFATIGVSGDLGWQLREGGTGRGTALVLGAAVSYLRPSFGGTPWHVGSVTLPFTASWAMGPHWFLLSPRASIWLEGARGQHPIGSAGLGLGLGTTFDVGRRWELTPEIVWNTAPLSFTGAVEDPERNGVTTAELGLTFARTKRAGP